MKDYFKYFDKFTFALLLLLALAGIFLVYSAGHSTAETNYLKQAAWLGVSLLVFFAVFSLKIDFVFRKAFAALLVLLVILALQVAVGGTVARTKSWFRLWGIGIQFSEFVKVPLALYLAKFLAQYRNRRRQGVRENTGRHPRPRRPDRPPARHGGVVHPLRLHPAGRSAEEGQAGAVDRHRAAGGPRRSSSAGIRCSSPTRRTASFPS